MLFLHYMVVDANLLELVRQLSDLSVRTRFREKHHHLCRRVWLKDFSVRRTSLGLIYCDRVLLRVRVEELVRGLRRRLQ